MIGCDLHDASLLLKVAEDRQEPETRSFRNTPAGRETMVKNLQGRSAAAGGARVVFVYEASCQGFGLYDQLQAAGIETYVLAPTHIERSAKDQRMKTDERDAQRLLELVRGHVLAGNALPAVWVPDPQTRDDRELVRARLELREKTTRVKAQIQTLFKRHGVTKPEGLKGSWSRGYRAWVQGLVVREGRLGAGTHAALGTLWRQLVFLEEEIALVDAKVETLAVTVRYEKPVAALCRFTGVGVLTAMVFLTEMGDLKRFQNRRQVAAYLGLAPASHESGEATDRKGHITHQGPSRVRRVLCQAVWSSVRYDETAQAAHARLTRGAPKRRKTATVALMRRLSIRMWHAGLEAQGPAGSFVPRVSEAARSRAGAQDEFIALGTTGGEREKGPAWAGPSPPYGHRPRRSGRTPAEPYPPGRQE